MKNKQNKKLLKEEEGLSTPKPFNRYDDSDTEKTIKGVLEKEFNEFTLKLYQHQGETEYINLILCTEIEDLSKGLEFKRYEISAIIANFRKKFISELSKYLNFVNVNCRGYNYVKGTDKLQFSITILLSDNNITDWVTGRIKKLESNKEFIKESKNYKLEQMSESNIKNILTSLHYQVLNEGKVTKSFETKKDEFEVKEKLKKEGVKASVEKKGTVRVTYNDKKVKEEDIKKLMEAPEMKNVKIILENLHRQVISEARPKKDVPVKTQSKTPVKKKVNQK